MGKTERIHRKTVVIIAGILLLLLISGTDSCSTAMREKAGADPTSAKAGTDTGNNKENTPEAGTENGVSENTQDYKETPVFTGEEYIRVLLKNSDYQGIYHKEVRLSCNMEWELHYGVNAELTEQHTGGEEVLIDENSEWFTECTRIVLMPTDSTGKINLPSVKRSQGMPSYRGNIEIRKTAQGLVVINELPLEEYLYGVLPSEMPVSYPIEALKAQAICARTYAYTHLQNPGYEEWNAHVDDSIGYQVYNNTAEKEEAVKAVQDTKGLVVRMDGKLVDTYYYSTSCGFGADERIWNPTEGKAVYLAASSIGETAMRQEKEIFTAKDMCRGDYFHEFLHNPPETDFERQEPWYRWSVTVEQMDEAGIKSVIEERWEAEPERVLTEENGEYAVSQDSRSKTAGITEDMGSIKDICIGKRMDGGIAESLVIKGEKKTVLVLSQYNIRAVLCAGGITAVRQDGSEVKMNILLPSAFFEIETIKDGENMIGYKLYGGGYGHGAGMSQNAARHMAEKGYASDDILLFFYKNCKIEKVNE